MWLLYNKELGLKKSHWTNEQIREWVESQKGHNYWYQTIELKDDIVIKGTIDSIKRLEQLNLDENLTGKSVLDIGCNSGMLCLESKKRGADRVVGIDLQENRLEQARTISEIMNMDIEYKNIDLFNTSELGKFDIVFCIAVLTEVTDLIKGMEILKEITNEVLYLEIAMAESEIGKRNLLYVIINKILDINFRKIINSFKPTLFKSQYYGNARLRRIDSRRMKGWALDPDIRFVHAVMGDEFKIYDLGNSVRYHLFKMVRNNKI